ncbi:unnamed protein product, partial [Didymodactylos carnosus]
EAEREVLTLAPHFEPKSLPESFDSKIARLTASSFDDITWLHLLNYQNAISKRIDNRQLLSFDSDCVGRTNLYFLHLLPRLVQTNKCLSELPLYSENCLGLYPSEQYSQSIPTLSQGTNEPRTSIRLVSSKTSRSQTTQGTAASSSATMTDEDFSQCPNMNMNLFKRELPTDSTSLMSLAWYSTNSININSDVTTKEKPFIYAFYTIKTDEKINNEPTNVLYVPLFKLLDLHKRYLPIAQVAETHPKQISQENVQTFLNELSGYINSKEKKSSVIPEGVALKQPMSKIPTINDSQAFVQLESFLNAKFGSQTSNVQLRDWFSMMFRLSSNNLFQIQD